MESTSISKIVPLTDSVQSFLLDYQSNNDGLSFKTIGGIFSNSKYVWYANGPRFEIVESRTGRKVASWTFGSILKDTATKVVCVSEIPCLSREIPLLVIGLECALNNGILCVFDILTSKILRTIQVDEKVSCLHVIDCGSNIFPILGPLKAFDGVVAVGLVGGNVLLIDLCQQWIDDAKVSNVAEDIKGEVDACQIISLTVKDINAIEDHKQRATQLGNHLSIILNAVLDSKSPHFILKGPKGEDRVHVNKIEVLVTSLFYSSQLGSLLVGYNFGAWQLWNIINMTLVYTSPVYEENIPVSHFTVQEPADDPRAFCYVWAVYSNTEENNVGFPIAVLYSLNYEVKDFHEGYGYLYQDLHSCAVRFQTELTAVGDKSKSIKSARCLRLTAFNKGCSSRTSMQESHEDTLTICSMVWNVWHAQGVDTYMSIFDLNQWYKEQMPSSPQQNCFSYLSYICVTDILNECSNNSTVVDVLIDETSMNQFIGIQKPEEHYYPTALAYEYCACTDKNIVFSCNKGQQRALLACFDTNGPLILLKPKEIFQQSIRLGLTPLFIDPVQSDLNLQRELLLNIALEQQMLGFLCKCVSTWSNGSFAGAGCSLEFFLNWAWNRAVTLKTNADKLCESLFDYSDVSLDANNRRILNNCASQISNLHRVYDFICNKLQLPLANLSIVRQQESCLHMIVTYLEVLQWLMNIGLLPEFSEDSIKTFNRAESVCAPYPIKSLLEYYRKRRSSLATKSPYLYIDTFIENEFGGDLLRFWKDDGGDGNYPPPSLQSLLRTYLIKNVDIVHKHCLIIYLFLDLAMALDQSRFKFIITNLIKFPTVFRINPSVTKITQAFWQLDHGDFATAMDQLLDPLINELDLKTWHHRTILNALFLQEQHNFALLYFQVRKPPLETTQDVLNILSLYIMNHMIDEAINFCRVHASQENETELIRHILQECKKTDQILEFVYYPLNQKEEEVLMKYLDDISYDHFEEFRVFYYLHRSRYIDIYQMKNKDRLQPTGLQSQKELGICDSTMKAITNYFPKVTRDILNMCYYEKNVRNEISRPKPMSVFVHNAEEKAKYKSTLIRAGIHKARETWTHPILDKSVNESLPFIKTPTALLSGSRKRTSMICSKVVNIEDGSSPEKRRKLNEEESFIDSGNTSERNAPSLLDMSKLLTPIIKRKVDRGADVGKITNERVDICTPQSILKVRNLVISQSPTTTTTHPSIVTSKNVSPPSNTTIGVLGLTPRKSLSRSGVRFEKINESYLTDSSEMVNTLDITNVSNQNSKSSEMKSSPSLEAFYSPNTSGNDNEEDQTTNVIDNVEPSLITNIEKSQVITDTVTKITESEQELKRVPLKSRNTYRDSHSRPENFETKSQEVFEKLKEDIVIDEIGTVTRRQTRSSRGKSQEPEGQMPALLSPRRSSLRISKRQSVSKLVSEDNGLSALYSQNSTQSLVADASAISSLASEDFDRMIENQSFSIPHISLSPTKCSTCIDTDESTDKVKLEESTSKSVSMVETREQPITEKQSRRSSFKVKARKSLSRMVLERNLGTMYTSTPHHSFVEETRTESMSSSNVSTHIPGTSELSPLEQQELDRLINNQDFDIPNFSLSLDRYSEDSSVTPEERSAITNREKSNGADNKLQNAPKTSENEIDTDTLLSNKSSRRLSGRISFRNKDTSKKEKADTLRIDDKKDPVTDYFRLDSDFRSQEISNKQLEVAHVLESSQNKHIDSLTENLELQQDTGVECDAALHEHLSKLEPPDYNQIEETRQVDADDLPENTEINDNNICLSIIPDREDIAIYQVSNLNELNNAQILDTNIIEIPDSSSSSCEEYGESDKSFKGSNIGDEECSASPINSDSEISSVESSNDINDTSGELEEPNNAFLQMQTNMELDSQYVTEVVVGDSSDEMENMEVEFENVAYTDVIEEILVADTVEQHQDAENEGAQIGEIETSSSRGMEIYAENKGLTEDVNTSLTEDVNTSLEDEKGHLEESNKIQLNSPLMEIDQSNQPERIRSLEFENVKFIVDELEPSIKDCENKDNTSSYPHSHLENLSTEESAVDENTVKSDITDIEKGASENILNTNILDNNLIDNSTSKIDVDSKHELASKEASNIIDNVTKAKLDYTNEAPESGDLIEMKEPTSSKDDNQYTTDLVVPIEHSHKMQLRKRRLSNTSIESPQKRTPRKRSVSVDEIINREQTSRQPAVSLKPKILPIQENEPNIQNIQNNPRSLRTRRAASVSDISDAQVQISSSKRKSKKTTSVSNLPIISEESTKINKESSKPKVTDEKAQTDEFEEYSTSRRLTRNQKHLLERSKGKGSTLSKIPERIATSAEETTDNDDGQRAEVSTVSDTRGRVRTRRISQESTSSLISTGNSASDAGSPPKRTRSSQKSQPNSPLPQTSALRRGRSRSIDEVSVTSQISKSSRTTRQSDISDSGDQSVASLRRSTRNRSKTPDTDIGSKGSSRDKKVLGKIPEETVDESKELPIKRSKSKRK